MLTSQEIEAFQADGYVALRRAVPAAVVRECQEAIWAELAGQGVLAGDPGTWTPGDAGWHIEASYEKDGRWQVNYRSRARGLLALYLFTDVDADSAPTRLRPGSHRDTAGVLGPAGDEAANTCHRCCISPALNELMAIYPFCWRAFGDTIATTGAQ